MMKLIIITLSFFISSQVFAAFDTSTFMESNFSEWENSLKELATFPAKATESMYDGAFTSMKLVVKYTGKSRRVSKVKSKFLDQYGDHVIQVPGLATLYQHEIEVVQDGKSHWVGVQSEVFPHLAKELKQGESFTIYCRFAGVAKQKQPVYTMMEFDSTTTKN